MTLDTANIKNKHSAIKKYNSLLKQMEITHSYEVDVKFAEKIVNGPDTLMNLLFCIMYIFLPLMLIKLE